MVAVLSVDPDAEAAGLKHSAQLRAALEDQGHTVDTSSFPITGELDKWVRQLGAIRLIDLNPYAERLICLSPLATLIRHRRKVHWCDELLSDQLPERFAELDRRLSAEVAFVPRTPQGYDRLAALGVKAAAPLALPSSATEWDAAVERLLAA